MHVVFNDVLHSHCKCNNTFSDRIKHSLHEYFLFVGKTCCVLQFNVVSNRKWTTTESFPPAGYLREISKRAIRALDRLYEENYNPLQYPQTTLTGKFRIVHSGTFSGTV